MTWNYRIVKDQNGGFSVREVYYEEGTDNVVGWTEPIRLDKFETANDVLGALELMRQINPRELVLPQPTLEGLDDE